MGSPRSTVGRDRELATIHAFLTETRPGPAGLLLEGEAGIGKTTLWREAVRAAEPTHLTLIARPGEPESPIAFAGLIDLLGTVADEVAAGLPEPQRDAFDAAMLRSSARKRIEPGAVAVALTTGLRNLAAEGPLAVAIDDVQWLDDPTRRALRFALRRLRDAPVTMISTVRDGGTGELLDDDAIVRVRVAPLTLGATYRLVHEHLGAALARPTLRQIHETSGGNPFFALELARALLDRGSGQLDAGGHLPVPHRLDQLLRDRIARLSRPARRTLMLVAAMSAPSVAAVLAVVGERAARDLAQAESAGILDTRDGIVRFVHPMLAAVAYGDATPAERRSTHRALADAVGDAEERARHHALAASGPDPAVAAALDQAAISAAQRGASDIAARFAIRALELTPPDDRAAAYRRAMDAGLHVLNAGDRARARPLIERAVADAPGGQQRAEALLHLAELSSPLGHGLSLCDRSLLDAGDDPALASRIHRTRGAIAYFLGDVPSAERHARVGVELAERSGDAVALGMAVAELAHWTFCGGGGVRGDLFEHAIALDGSAGAAAPRSHLAKVLMDGDRLDEARALLATLLNEAMEVGDLHAASTHQIHLAELEGWAGRWDLAISLAEESLQLRAHTESASAPLYVKAMALACLGRIEEAQVEAETGLAEAERAEDVVFRMQNLHVLGFIALSRDDPTAAHAHLGVATDLLRPRWSNEFGDCHVVPDEIEALTVIGELARAEDLCDWMETVGRKTQRAWTQATAARARALIQAARNDLDGAASACEAALLAHENLPMPFELARTLMINGVVQRRMKRRAVAQGTLTRALGIFEQLGASLWAAKARAQIARLGDRSSAQPALTPVEEQIAVHVAAGATNREIADALFLSAKTVEANLTRIYRKLGIRSRAELAARSAGDG